ncbi:probable protein phosphatase 2C 55 [Primulina eburnea]|uniref:probable protein phosphatase 2C 55 n=1 Tax=Primulina eburnea TaxID=1245227 RepID=UPI003C6C35E1
MVIIRRKFKRSIRKRGRPKIYMAGGSFYSPKNNKSKPLGVDAHFISKEADAIGVADGVGRCGENGIDAGEFSRELMRNALESIKNHPGGDVVLDPKRVLYEAFSNTKAKGSSTACIITLSGRHIRAANLGDSRFMVMRRGKIVYTSPVQQHKFNHPYQLGKYEGGDVLEKAEEIMVPVECYDIIVAGTDGLFDNMFPEDIEAVVKQCLGEGYDQNPVAFNLAMAARRNSLDKTRCSPFDINARQAGVLHFGGKYDDITVVVAHILPSS